MPEQNRANSREATWTATARPDLAQYRSLEELPHQRGEEFVEGYDRARSAINASTAHEITPLSYHLLRPDGSKRLMVSVPSATSVDGARQWTELKVLAGMDISRVWPNNVPLHQHDVNFPTLSDRRFQASTTTAPTGGHATATTSYGAQSQIPWWDACAPSDSQTRSRVDAWRNSIG